MRALITGASSGIGRDIAKELSQKGYDLILVARNLEKLNEVKEKLETNIETVSMDISNPENCKQLYEKYKDIDILVNNAGFGDCGYFDKTNLEKELQMINTNIVAYHVLTKLYLKDMKAKNSGKILNVASIAGFMPGPLMATYYSTKDGGLSKGDLIPEISKLAKENTNFSDTDKLGGAYTLYGTTWTVGAMSAQTAGVPLKLSIDDNSMGEYSTFLDGAYSIGQVLENNGYTNYLLLGSDATFGGRRNLFKQHGNYEIWDFESAKEENKASEQIWWGFTDDQLFEYAKEKILNLSKQEKPFNFTFLTADTHFPDGFLCKDCPNKWDEQYKNVISCSSKRVGDFVKWLQKQDFYDNTTIVITGDHLTMQANFFEPEEGQQYDKKVVNVIINPAIEAENTKRVYSTMDLYPTTLGALGAKIEGNRLGLGTNLFSNEKTLIEKYGVEYVNNELKNVSRFYDNSILVK